MLIIPIYKDANFTTHSKPEVPLNNYLKADLPPHRKHHTPCQRYEVLTAVLLRIQVF